MGSMLVLVRGSHIGLAYSRRGLTNVLEALSFTLLLRVFRFRRRKPTRVLFALVTEALM
jgi:hypothetical protein